MTSSMTPAGLANEKGLTLAEALAADAQGRPRIDRATIDRLTSPENYLGLAPTWSTGCWPRRGAEEANAMRGSFYRWIVVGRRGSRSSTYCLRPASPAMISFSMHRIWSGLGSDGVGDC